MKIENWQKVEKQDLAEIINLINQEQGFDIYSLESSSAKKAATPFYKSLELLEVTEFGSIPPLTMRFFLKNDKIEIFKLDGSKEALLDINKIEKPKLDDKNVVAYAKFALGSVMGEEGSFRLIENVDEIEFSREPTEKEQKMLLAAIKPAKANPSNEGFTIDANVLYSDCVYRAIITVTNDGMVDIKEEKTMLTDMPTREIMLL